MLILLPGAILSLLKNKVVEFFLWRLRKSVHRIHRSINCQRKTLFIVIQNRKVGFFPTTVCDTLLKVEYEERSDPEKFIETHYTTHETTFLHFPLTVFY